MAGSVITMKFHGCNPPLGGRQPQCFLRGWPTPWALIFAIGIELFGGRSASWS